MGHHQLVDNMERVWQAIGRLCADFDEAQWKTTTDCPGWSVQDQISHIVGSESGILGRPEPDHTPADLSHTKNDLGRRNEVVVDWRRPWPGARVLEEFRDVTAERMTALRAMTADDFEVQTQTPVGPGSMRTYLAIRIFDAWVHEQDIRRALDLPGSLDGPVADHAMSRIVLALPFVVGKKAQAPDGSSVVFDVSGPTRRCGFPSACRAGAPTRWTKRPTSRPSVCGRTSRRSRAWRAGGGTRRRCCPPVVSPSRGTGCWGEMVVRQMNFMILGGE